MEVGVLNIIQTSCLGENEIEKPFKRIELDEIEQFSKHTIWITYRKNMPPIKDKTADAGWGCMIRSLQMILAQTFVTLILGNNWKYDSHPFEIERNLFHIKSIINLFGDSPGCLLSIHRLCAKASLKGINEGQWWGPSFASEIAVEHLNEIHPFNTRAYIAKIGRIISTEIEEIAIEDKIFRPCIIFVPLRLGPQNAEPEFKSLLKDIFDIPQCMGMIGGEPGFAHFFHTYDGERLYFLDPHVTQSCVNMKKEWSIKTYFVEGLISIVYEKLDPSVSLVFLVKNLTDWNNFKSCLETNKFSKLFSLRTEKDENTVNYDDFLSIDSDFEFSDED